MDGEEERKREGGNGEGEVTKEVGGGRGGWQRMMVMIAKTWRDFSIFRKKKKIKKGKKGRGKRKER